MLAIFSVILLATAFDADMSVSQMRATGVAKLSAKEKRALGKWIEENYSKKTPTAPVAAAKQKAPIIEENLNSGRYIRLSDKTLWEIHPSDTLLTQGWITPVEIKIERTNEDSNYPFTLTNTLTGSSVRARPTRTMNSK
jgi:hypothetical protein